MTLEIKGLDKLQKSLSKLSVQMDYALSRTINDLSFESKASLEKDIAGRLNTRVNTSKAYAVDKSSKKNLEATVRMKSDWHKVALVHHYTGGRAVPIMFERAMMKRGYMSKNNSVVPIGKIGKVKYKTLLQQTAPGVPGRDHFVVAVGDRSSRVKHLSSGIYKRLKRKVKPVALFTDEAEYKKRLDMNEIVEKKVKRRADELFTKHLRDAMRTAR